MTAVTFRRLERLGRLGNQVWEIASTLGVADRMGAPAVFRPWSYAPYFSLPETLWVENLPATAMDAETSPCLNHIAERHRAYMQDRALWAHIEDRIVEYFQPSDLALQVLMLTNKAFFDIPKDDRIAIHIRRGDAVGIPELYPLQSPLYVKAVLEEFGDGEVFLFTDDAGWAKDHLSSFKPRIIVGNADWADMFMMASADRIAIANSSFSYWAATTSAASKVCFPLAWYGRKFRDLDYRLMIPKHWVGIHDPQAGRL